mgnify:CR=1 FL=1
MKIVLASASPRRRELLSAVCKNFEIKTAETDEHLPPSVHPRDGVEILAVRKGRAVLDTLDASEAADSVIISSDTLVELSGVPLGKPADKAGAAAMLRSLSGKRHNVHTGIAVHARGGVFSGVATTGVYFRDMSDGEIEDYIATGEPMDKAGAYGIQGGAAIFAEKLCGDYYNVVGFPISKICVTIKELFGCFTAPATGKFTNLRTYHSSHWTTKH